MNYTPPWIVTLSMLVAGGMGLIFSIPMWQKKIPPNGITGFRTEKTLTNPELWYLVNSIVGRNTTIFCLLFVVVVLVTHFTVTPKHPTATALLLATFLSLGLGVIALHGFFLTQ